MPKSTHELTIITKAVWNARQSRQQPSETLGHSSSPTLAPLVTKMEIGLLFDPLFVAGNVCVRLWCIHKGTDVCHLINIGI